MSSVKVVVLRTTGINCEQETCRAWQLAGASADLVHLQRVIDKPDLLDNYDVLTLPGGFSYGDDVSAGRIFANRLMQYLGDHLRRFVDRDRLVLGICNGFQVLVKTGLLAADGRQSPCTLALNDCGHYACRWVTLQTVSDHCVFLEPGRRYFLPMAHAEGRFAIRSQDRLSERLVALRYVAGVRRVGPENPNGSFADLAGLTDTTGRVLGLMPHPDRFLDRTQHPFWTALGEEAEPDGLAIFRAGIRRFQ